MVVKQERRDSHSSDATENIEDKDEYKKRIFHQKVIESMNTGRLFYRQHDYDKAIVEFKKCLKLRESFIGRYDEFTPSIYFFLGNCYYKKQNYDNALVAYRTRIRIRRWLTGDNTFPSIDKRLLFCLKKKGFNPQQVDDYDTNLNASIRCEKNGDTYRRRGNYSKAITTYRHAIEIEKASQVGIKVTVAFLWRKIAFLLDKKGDTLCTDNYRHFYQKEQSFDCTIDIENDISNLEKALTKAQEVQETKPLSFACSPISKEVREKRQANEKREDKVGKMKEKKEDPAGESIALVSGAEETNVFVAIKTLADSSNEKVDWNKVVSCVDVKVNLHEADKRTRRRSMPEIRRPRRVSRNKAPHRRSCTDFYEVQKYGKQTFPDNQRISSHLFSLEENEKVENITE